MISICVVNAIIKVDQVNFFIDVYILLCEILDYALYY